jgi:MFS family permease
MPTIAAATSGVPLHEAGIASGLISTSQQMGGALGLSILSGVAASVTAAALHPGSLQADIKGYHVAFLIAAGFMLLASLIAATVIRSPKKPSTSEEAENIARRQQLQSSMIH